MKAKDELGTPSDVTSPKELYLQRGLLWVFPPALIGRMKAMPWEDTVNAHGILYIKYT